MWRPLLSALGLDPQTVTCPALPGFAGPAPHGFSATKEAYTDWLITELESLHAETGPVDIVGHDWGAILTLRAVCLKPQLVRSWAVGGAVIHANYRGHRLARIWNTPLLGEMFMALSPKSVLQKGLQDAGLPPEVAAEEITHWTRSKRQCILSLYRSAKGLHFKDDWIDALINLPARGLVLWGEQDPYVETRFGAEFAERQNVPFQSDAQTGHWVFAQSPDFCATHLKLLWA